MEKNARQSQTNVSEQLSHEVTLMKLNRLIAITVVGISLLTTMTAIMTATTTAVTAATVAAALPAVAVARPEVALV